MNTTTAQVLIHEIGMAMVNAQLGAQNSLSAETRSVYAEQAEKLRSILRLVGAES